MSACQSRPDASSCASAAPLAGPAALPAFTAGAEPIRLSDAVVAKVAELLAEQGEADLMLRIYVTGGGCSGFQYGFAFDDERREDDLRVERGPVAIVVDAISLQYLAGAEIDYEDKLEGARFVIRNPNAASTCGCGSSFAV